MRKLAVPLLLALLAAGAGWYFFRERPGPVSAPPPPTPPAAAGDVQLGAAPAAPSAPPEASDGPVAPSTQPAAAVTPAAPAAPAPVEPLAPELAKLPPATILENMRTTIRLYGQRFGGNPVGTNPEITAALLGNNPKQLNFLKADGNRVNAKGELVDAWGTPYFFHQLSGVQTEIRSAGADRIMYTVDDLVIR